MKSATRCIRKVSIQCKWNKMKSIQKLVALLLFFSWNKYKNSDVPVTTSVTIQMYVSDDWPFWCFTSMHGFLTSLLGWWCRVLFQSSEAEGCGWNPVVTNPTLKLLALWEEECDSILWRRDWLLLEASEVKFSRFQKRSATLTYTWSRKYLKSF